MNDCNGHTSRCAGQATIDAVVQDGARLRHERWHRECIALAVSMGLHVRALTDRRATRRPPTTRIRRWADSLLARQGPRLTA